MKKIWEKPQLVVLTKGRTEERVLETCKMNELEQGAIAQVNFCHNEACAIECSTLAAS